MIHRNEVRAVPVAPGRLQGALICLSPRVEGLGSQASSLPGVFLPQVYVAVELLANKPPL